jgi:hypothetical protein
MRLLLLLLPVLLLMAPKKRPSEKGASGPKVRPCNLAVLMCRSILQFKQRGFILCGNDRISDQTASEKTVSGRAAELAAACGKEAGGPSLC